MALLTERYASKIRGVLSCFDRVVITGTIPDICHADAMSSYLSSKESPHFRLYPICRTLAGRNPSPRRGLAQENGLEIEFIRKKDFRKEERIKKIIAKRGDHPGLVHIFSAMEPCPSFKPWHDKKTGKTFLSARRPSASTTISTSSLKIWGCAICGCRPGLPFGCSSILMGTIIWLAVLEKGRSPTVCWKMGLSGWRLCQGPATRRYPPGPKLHRQLDKSPGSSVQ